MGGVWVKRTQRQVIRMGVDRSTLGNVRNAVSVENAPSPFLIGIVATYPPCVLKASLRFANKWKSTFADLVGNTQKLDAIVDRKLLDDMDSASIFSKLIGYKLSNGYRGVIYLSCRMKFMADVVQTQTPQLMDLRF